MLNHDFRKSWRHDKNGRRAGAAAPRFSEVKSSAVDIGLRAQPALRSIVALMVLGGVSAAFASDAEIYDKKCKVCHSIAGVGGAKADKGGPLDGVGSKRDEAWLRAYFADPKSQIEDAKMPKLKLASEEWDAMVRYMLSLK